MRKMCWIFAEDLGWKFGQPGLVLPGLVSVVVVQGQSGVAGDSCTRTSSLRTGRALRLGTDRRRVFGRTVCGEDMRLDMLRTDMPPPQAGSAPRKARAGHKTAATLPTMLYVMLRRERTVQQKAQSARKQW